MCNTNHFRCWSSPDIIGFGWNMPLLGPFRQRCVLPVLAACWPRGAQTAGSVPWKIIQFKKKNPQKWAHNPQLIFQVETVSPIWTNDCTLPYRSAHASLLPLRMNEILPDRKILTWPGSPGTPAYPGCHPAPDSRVYPPHQVGDSHDDLPAEGSRMGCKQPPGENLHQLPELGFGLWLNAKKKNSSDHKHLGGKKKQSETGLVELLCCRKWKWTIKMEFKILCCNSL